MAGARTFATFALITVLVFAGLTAFLLANQGTKKVTGGLTNAECGLPVGPNAVRSSLKVVRFGSVTEYALPQPSRSANAVTVSEDGSVWFGEQAVPGVGHLFLNGTLVEYAWPSSQEGGRIDCGYRTGIWGVEAWNGEVWAADSDENALVGVGPADGHATVVNVTGKATLPYTLAVAPDGALWFTTVSSSSVLGRVNANLSVTVYPVNGLGGEVPLQVQFVNSTLAYFVALSHVSPYGHLYSFDPEDVGTSINAVRVGGSFHLLEPSSVSVSGSSVWVTQHGASDVAEYDTKSGNWTVFPTSTVNFTLTTLPYFIDGVGQEVWFSEHYANRIAVLNSTASSLTEYSEADPPVESGNSIQNDLTIAPGDGGLWFPSVTGNYVGFVNGSLKPSFSLDLQGTNSLELTPGQTATLNVAVEGNWSLPLNVGASDSENYDSVPHMINIVPDSSRIPAGSGRAQLEFAISPSAGLLPGSYILAVSVSDGLVTQTVYCFLRFR